MKAYFEGRIKVWEKGETWIDWEDKSKGKMPLYRYVIQSDEQEIVQFNSTEDYSKFVDVNAVFTVEMGKMRNQAGAWWVKLVKVVGSGAH